MQHLQAYDVIDFETETKNSLFFFEQLLQNIKKLLNALNSVTLGDNINNTLIYFFINARSFSLLGTIVFFIALSNSSNIGLEHI